MVRALKKLGFVNERQVGSHVRMVKGTWRATVPMHTPTPTRPVDVNTATADELDAIQRRSDGKARAGLFGRAL